MKTTCEDSECEGSVDDGDDSMHHCPKCEYLVRIEQMSFCARCENLWCLDCDLSGGDVFDLEAELDFSIDAKYRTKLVYADFCTECFDVLLRSEEELKAFATKESSRF